MEIKIGDKVLVLRNNLGIPVNVNKVCTVIEGPLGNKFKYKVTYDGVGYWCDVVPATKLHRLLLGVE